MERRGLKREQLLMLPFYPVKDPNPFQGFPLEANGHLTIFSGGDIYKTLDKRRTYWKLVKMILDKYPDVVFLFATKHNLISGMTPGAELMGAFQNSVQPVLLHEGPFKA